MPPAEWSVPQFRLRPRAPVNLQSIAMNSAARLLTLAEIAEHLGLGVTTVRNYHQRAERNRREHRERPGDFPPPDQHFGRTPVWRAATIAQWQRTRPGRGAGGGRPRREPSNG